MATQLDTIAEKHSRPTHFQARRPTMTNAVIAFFLIKHVVAQSRTHRQIYPLRIMKVMTGGNRKKLMRQVEQTKDRGGMPGF